MATAPPQQPASLVVPQVARVLPGPAGKLQQLAAAGALQQATPEALGLKDHCSTHSTRASIGHDICFQSHVWREATSFVDGSQQQLHTVKMAKDLSLGKVPKMLVVLGAVQPSGVNSAFCRVKDPTGSMGAAFHQSVLQHQQYQQGWLGPGTVVLLQQVSVFTPTPGTSYLAVTASNICKVWSDTSAYQRLRNPQPMQQQQQTQQTQQHAGKLHSQAPQQWPSGANSQLDSTPQLPSHSSRQPQHTSQPQQQQQQQQQTQGISGGQPLVQPQHGGSPSVAGSNRSSAFFPSSPDVTSLFRKPTQQPQAQQQQQKGDFQQQQQQQQLHQQQPLQSQQGWQQSIQGQVGSCGLVTQRPPATVSQPQQHQQQQGRAQNQGSTGTGRGLMLPPAPRAPTSFRAQLHKQQHQQQTRSQAPNAGHQCQLQGQPLSQAAAGRRTPNAGPQLLDDLLDELVNLEDASDRDAINLGGATAAITATDPAKKLAANGYHRISSSMRASGFASIAPSQQQIQQSTDSQTPRTSSQSVPAALLQQGQLQHTSVGSSRAGSSNHAPASGVGAAGNDAAEAIDGVDDVVAAIFGSQMAPRPAAATTGGLVDHATPSAAVASIFGRQMAPPGHNNTHAGKPFSNTQQVQQTAGNVFSRSPAVDSSSRMAGNNIGRSTKDSLTGSGVGDIQRLPTQSDAKRLKVSPATGPPMPGPPLQPVSGRLNMQQQQQIQQPPVSQQASRQHKTQAGLQMTQHRGNLGGFKPSAATPLRPLLGLQGAGAAASLLDDLLGNDLEYLDDL